MSHLPDPLLLQLHSISWLLTCTYTAVEYPIYPCAGTYQISVSLIGEALPGSPFSCVASVPLPLAKQCLIVGESLTRATAREVETFRISFRDAQGRVAYAEELDIYVTRDIHHAMSGGTLEAEWSTNGAKGERGGDAQRAERAPSAARASDTGGRQYVRASAASAKLAPRIPSLNLHVARVQTLVVGEKPLIVRSDYQPDSERLGTFPPRRLMHVMRLEPFGGGVRACIALDDPTQDARLLDTWRGLTFGRARWKFDPPFGAAPSAAATPQPSHRSSARARTPTGRSPSAAASIRGGRASLGGGCPIVNSSACSSAALEAPIDASKIPLG